MEHIRKILPPVIDEMGIDKPIKKYQALAEWSSVVGDKINAVTEPVRVEDGKIFVRVKNDAWRNEIYYIKSDIIEKLNKKVGKKVIQDLILI